MALIFMDGGETYEGDCTSRGPWTSGSNMQSLTSTPVTGARSIRPTGSGAEVAYVIPESDRSTKMTLGFRLVLGTSANTPIARLHNGVQVSLAYRSISGGIDVDVSGASRGVIPVVYPFEGYLEVQVEADSSIGKVKAWLDGELTVDWTGNTGSDSYFMIAAGPQANHQIFRYDDIYLTNDVGPAPYNDRLGPISIVGIAPTSDVSTDFTPSTGSDNYALVDEIPHNGDTDYIESDTPGDTDVYGFGDLPDSNVDVLAVKMKAVARKVGDNPIAYSVISVQDSDESESDDAFLGPAYVSQDVIFTTPPGGEGSWTPTSVNSSNFGVRVKDVE